MQISNPSHRRIGGSRVTRPPEVTPEVFDENELALRWRLSVKTLRRWRQNHQGPVFCKLGSRVRYQIAAIEAFERQVARFSTFARAYQ
jgi:hypothetical protein